ncbi:hypothetical protein [uncultured Roseobacter sp.]|uniref:hypothetical protein n=1 Tax=uncultured Roseobacter sp. TaxID=114847 RepID=UPI00260A8256|nr:hypothetical protein [uncultured Roseobacter sp.]
MLTLAQINTPVRHLNVSGIVRAVHQATDLFIADLPAVIFVDEVGFTFEKALHLCLRLKTPRGKTFQRFRDDGSNGLIPYK